MNTYMLITTGGFIVMMSALFLGIGLCHIEERRGYQYRDVIYLMLQYAILLGSGITSVGLIGWWIT